MCKWFYHKVTCLLGICLDYSLSPQMSVNHWVGPWKPHYKIPFPWPDLTGPGSKVMPRTFWYEFCWSRVADVLDSSQVISEGLVQPYIYMCSPRRENRIQVKMEDWNTLQRKQAMIFQTKGRLSSGSGCSSSHKNDFCPRLPCVFSVKFERLLDWA